MAGGAFRKLLIPFSVHHPATVAEQLILVNEANRAVGCEEKWAVHATGLLHRAFSIFLVDDSGRLLLQRRAGGKYHSAGLWANSCCGHPRPGERTLAAARRRLGEELGATVSLRPAFRARYRTELENGLVENELVYVFFGRALPRLEPNPAEVSAVEWVGLDELLADLTRRPARYAYWLLHYLRAHEPALRRGITETLGGR